MLSPSIESEKNATGATSSTSSSHDLESLTAKRSDTVVEQIAERIEKLRADRILITFNAQLCFLKGCREIVRSKGHHECRVTLQDLKDYRDRVQRYEIEADRAIFHRSFFNEGLGIMSDMRCLIRILDRAIELFENGVIQMDEWLYYNDFSFDYTRVVSKWPFARHPLGMSCLLLFSYYLFTPILFCLIASSSNICNADRGYVGWIDALYFASSTISTVGYGDLTVNQDPRYDAFIGTVYMLVAMVVAVVVFSSVASSAFSPFGNLTLRIFDHFSKTKEEDLFLHQRIRRIRFSVIAEIVFEVGFVIFLGVAASRIAVNLDDEQDWTWMTSFYWATQTVTTIGYGDLSQPKGLLYFKIPYLLISTVLVGNALGNLGNLNEELAKARKQHQWNSRPVTKRLIDQMQAYEHDDKVDQFEFLVASLVCLGKVSSDDIRPIMDKFREHAGNKSYIAIEDMIAMDECPSQERVAVEE